MCEQCREREERDRIMWMAIRVGLLGVSRGVLAVVKAIEVRHDIQREEKKAA